MVVDDVVDGQNALFTVPGLKEEPKRKRRPNRNMTAERKAEASKVLKPWWVRYGKGRGQSYIAVYSVLCTALANGVTPKELKAALDIIGPDEMVVSGGAITIALRRHRKSDAVKFAEQASRRDGEQYYEGLAEWRGEDVQDTRKFYEEQHRVAQENFKAGAESYYVNREWESKPAVSRDDSADGAGGGDEPQRFGPAEHDPWEGNAAEAEWQREDDAYEAALEREAAAEAADEFRIGLALWKADERTQQQAERADRAGELAARGDVR